MNRTRLVTHDDAPALARLMCENRQFLGPFEPTRPESYFTEDGQRQVISHALEEHAAGRTHPRVILDDGRLVGRITLSGIERGPFQNCRLGYLVGEDSNGRGLATSAVREVVEIAFAELGLHRVEAGTLVDNVRSQRVLARNGFVRFGLAPAYLNIAGEWRDHVMYQKVRAETG
ncbi:MAG TPA: GNAT family protein [Nocardioidaceae bacterium]|nr:GNAT family protein [Nocardioidaceae bacterium]